MTRRIRKDLFPAVGLGLALALASVLSTRPLLAACPPERPLLSGPTQVQAGQTYSISWTNVLVDRLSAADYYFLERSSDPAFLSTVDRIKTSRSAQSLPPGPSAESVLYHRVVVFSSCPGGGQSVSNVLTVRVRTECPAPEPIGSLVVTPANPPPFSTYVISWDTGLGAGGPGGGDAEVKYRLRRVSSYESRETVSLSGSASFNDPPGDYTYQLRAEASCGTAGPWTLPLTVTIGSSGAGALVLYSEPRPIVALAGEAAVTAFVVRNGGTVPQEVTLTAGSDDLEASPQTVTIAPNKTQSVSVRATSTLGKPMHSWIDVTSPTAALRVPVDAVRASAPAATPVEWADQDVDIDVDGNPVLRTLVNPGDTEAAFVSSSKQPWLLIESLDGEPWDRPMKARETRVVRISVDRARRRASTGTETGAISLLTAGFAESARALVVTDDGPSVLYTVGQSLPSPALAKSRILYASIPNAEGASASFSSDVWLANLDGVSAIDVSVFLTPLGKPESERRQIDLKLGPGETRRYRNLVGQAGIQGAAAMELRSPSPTLSATALVNNTPTVSSSRSALARGPLASAKEQYGFEMRPISPGEGVKATDPEYVLSGLAHDPTSSSRRFKRRTNILLRETSGADTTVELVLFWGRNDPVTRSDVPVRIKRTVLANGSDQINDEEMFLDVDPPGDPNATSPYALVTFVSGFTDPFGIVRGSVVPIATVIDQGTEDASLRVGASTRSLSPVPPTASSTAGSASSAKAPAWGAEPTDGDALMANLPYQGKPSPLFFPATHLWGAPVSNGERPYWRSRVTLTNVGTVQRNLKFRMKPKNWDDDRELVSLPLFLTAGAVATFEDVIRDVFGIVSDEQPIYGTVMVDASRNADGSWADTWADVDVQTELYTLQPTQNQPAGEFSTGMEGFSYLHGYSSFQSNLGAVQFDAAERSSRYRTNLVLQEIAGQSCTVAVAAYLPGKLVPMATRSVVIPPNGYDSRELFGGFLGLDLSEVTDVRVVVRQIDGDGVFMAFASRINLATGDPANVFLHPASGGTGR